MTDETPSPAEAHDDASLEAAADQAAESTADEGNGVGEESMGGPAPWDQAPGSAQSPAESDEASDATTGEAVPGDEAPGDEASSNEALGDAPSEAPGDEASDGEMPAGEMPDGVTPADAATVAATASDGAPEDVAATGAADEVAPGIAVPVVTPVDLQANAAAVDGLPGEVAPAQAEAPEAPTAEVPAEIPLVPAVPQAPAAAVSGEMPPAPEAPVVETPGVETVPQAPAGAVPEAPAVDTVPEVPAVVPDAAATASADVPAPGVPEGATNADLPAEAAVVGAATVGAAAVVADVAPEAAGPQSAEASADPGHTAAAAAPSAPVLGGVLSPDLLDVLSQLAIEVPSWAYGNSGTRFKVFGQPGTPRDVFEKIADAAEVNRLTGLAPSVALHIPWDAVDDYAALGQYANSVGMRLGTINSNTFQDDDYKLGSLANPDPQVRAKAIQHNIECINVMDVTGSRDLKIWLADGTNYPGQDDIRDRQERLVDSLEQIYARIGPEQRLVLEYKFFEPAFYHTDVPDWGTSLLHCMALGERAMVCLDTGHHAPGTNIEFIVAQLLWIGRLGSFDFNSRFYADDDLMVGSADPFQLFRILHEVVRGGGFPNPNVALMLDQCHNIENHIAGQIRSVLNVQEALAKALLVDRVALREAQLSGQVLEANQILMDAYWTDVRADLAAWRESRGLPADPMRAFAESGYAQKVAAERADGAQAGWG